MKVGSTQFMKRQSEHERKSCCVSGEAARATVRMHNTAKSTADRKMRLRCDSRYLVHVVGGGVSRVAYRLGMWPLTYLRTYAPTYHALTYRRTPSASGYFFEKSMPPMTRPASSPPMCMKLSTKGVRPMQTCLE